MFFYVAFIWLCFLLQMVFLVATPQFQSSKHFCEFVIIIKATLNFLNIKLFVLVNHGVLCMSSSLHCCPLVNANFFSFQASHVCILLSYFLYACVFCYSHGVFYCNCLLWSFLCPFCCYNKLFFLFSHIVYRSYFFISI